MIDTCDLLGGAYAVSLYSVANISSGGSRICENVNLGNPLTRFRESPYRLGIPYLLRTKTAVEKRKRELEKFFAKISFSFINLCKKQEGIVFC